MNYSRKYKLLNVVHNALASCLWKCISIHPYHTPSSTGFLLFLEIKAIVAPLCSCPGSSLCPQCISTPLHIWLIPITESILKIGPDFHSFLYLRNITMCLDSHGCSTYVKFKIFYNVALTSHFYLFLRLSPNSANFLVIYRTWLDISCSFMFQALC